MDQRLSLFKTLQRIAGLGRLQQQSLDHWNLRHVLAQQEHRDQEPSGRRQDHRERDWQPVKILAGPGNDKGLAGQHQRYKYHHDTADAEDAKPGQYKQLERTKILVPR